LLSWVIRDKISLSTNPRANKKRSGDIFNYSINKFFIIHNFKPLYQGIFTKLTSRMPKEEAENLIKSLVNNTVNVIDACKLLFDTVKKYYEGK
jgi:hypothetical protein